MMTFASITQGQPRTIGVLLILLTAMAVGVGAALLPDGLTILAILSFAVAVYFVTLNTRWAAAAGTAGYIMALEWVYATVIAPAFGYAGLTYAPPDSLALAAIMLLAWSPVLGLPRSLGLLSESVLWTLFLLVYVPGILITFHLAGPVLPLYATLVIAIAILLVGQRMPRRPLLEGGLAPGRHRVVLILIGLAAMAIVVAAYGFALELPALDYVFDTRLDYKESSGPLQGVTAYVVPWLGRVICPLMLAVGMRDRSVILIGLAILGELMVYSAAGFRSAIFVPLLVVVGFLIAPHWRHGGRTFAWGVASVVAVTGVLATIGHPILASLLVRRSIVVPGQLTHAYYDFFSANPVYELRHSFLSVLGPPPYGPSSPPVLIGEIYFGGGHPNANLWADGIANFGIVGALAFTVVLAVGLWLGDGVTMRQGPAFGIAAGAIIGFTFSNTGIFTGTLSSGVGVLVLLLAIARRSVPVARAQAKSPSGPQSAPT